jgi:hypothetical protein
MTEPSCRGLRELLGVYVVGAIDPAERSLVDTHLETCHDCREELAGLAALPALLHRVSVADAQRIAGMGDPAHPDIEPSEQLLNSLLRQVRARRGTQRVRRVFALAASVLVAAGATVAVSQALAPRPPAQSPQVDLAGPASNGPLSGWVKYSRAPWGGTTISARITGFPLWTACKFWVLTKSGRMVLAGGWIVGPGSEHIWYPESVPVPKSQVAGFLVTATPHGELVIPAD